MIVSQGHQCQKTESIAFSTSDPLDQRPSKQVRIIHNQYAIIQDNTFICQLSFNTPANAGHPSAEELSFLPINGSSPRMQGKLVVMQ